MTAIYDNEGNEIAEIDLSEKQRAVLETGENIVMIYHTPQMLRYLLGEHTGTFVLHKHDEQVIVNDAGRLRKYADLQRAIKAAREHP